MVQPNVPLPGIKAGAVVYMAAGSSSGMSERTGGILFYLINLEHIAVSGFLF